MEDLQLVLFVLGAIAIIAVLVHGFWSIRRQQPKSIKDSPVTPPYRSAQERRDAEGFDADGIGAVRVRKMPHAEPSPQSKSSSRAQVKSASIDVEQDNDFVLTDAPKTRTPKQRQEPVLAVGTAGHSSRPEPEIHALPEDEPEQVSLFENEMDDEQDYEYHHAPEPTPAPKVEAPLPEPRDVLVLHVVANDGEELSGAELLPCMLTLNFKYGDMNIFHRHEDNAGNGKVLFSVANMLKPGIFDPDNMEQFSTQGVVLFMTLPCHGDAVMNFSIMLNSAFQLADDLGANVLDGQRQPWHNNTKQEYLRRIRAQA